MAGDFLSPSVYNSLQYEGRAIKGRQMVDAMNAAGMDIAVFGNHEFDLKEKELQERIDQSAFQWISSNCFHKQNNQEIPFTFHSQPVPKTWIMNVRDDDGTTARIGFFAICLPFTKADYVSYSDQLQTAINAYNQLKDSSDAVIAITHQSMEDDEALAKAIPGLAMIIGGHEHDQRYAKLGKVRITKALSNARSAYVLNLLINKKKNKFSVESKLEILNEKIPLDSSTQAVVQKWTDIAEKNYSSLGFDARRIISTSGTPLEGRESIVRNHPTNLTELIVDAMASAAPEAEVVLLNAGSIRVDDILQMPVTEYDIIRTLPFGGGILEASLRGSTLIKTLNEGEKNKNTGGYLLTNKNLQKNAEGNWTLNQKIIDPALFYRVVISEFLLSGKEANLDFLNPSNPEIKMIKTPENKNDSRSDIRLAVIRYLEQNASKN
jgi:2',3'-cyclic-nucleotide 2'-phosphodiesterase (5'-nucleotidase family)